MMKNLLIICLFALINLACKHENIAKNAALPELYVIILGTAQDAGYPQSGCTKKCCVDLWDSRSSKKYVSSIGIVDKRSGKTFLIDATPDMKFQIKTLVDQIENNTSDTPDGVFLTHGHMGHYTGLMHFGREAMGAKDIKTYVMPRMKNFLTENGPWSQLVSLSNISLMKLTADSTITLSKDLKITPFLVPHRDEFTETVGYNIESDQKKLVFIPDIDKWNKWETNIMEVVKDVDYALLDGTFYQNGEIPGRDMSLIPHPFVEESMSLFDNLPPSEKSKVFFIHFNHTNPLLRENSKAYQEVAKKGYNISKEGMIFKL